jgi:Ni/Co efflux regulator RcnB
MRMGLIMLATAASLGAAAIGASPAAAAGQYYGHGDRGYHHGWDRHDRWDRHREWRHHERERDRRRAWRHHHRYGYNGYYGRGYYGY